MALNVWVKDISFLLVWDFKAKKQLKVREVGLGKEEVGMDWEGIKTKAREASGLHTDKSEVHFLFETGS